MAALGLTTMIALSATAATAWADDPVAGQYTDGTAPLVKQVRAPQSLGIPGNSYTFEFTPGTVRSSSELSPNINNNDNLAGNGTDVLGNDNKITVAIAAKAAGDLTGESDGYYYHKETAVDALADTTFPHAGVYTYTVREVIPSDTTLGNGNMAYSQAEYTMDVYVANPNTSENPAAVLKVTFVQFTKTVNDDGTATAGSGVKAPLEFTNTYNKAVPFYIFNKVTGHYANINQTFTYDLTLTAAPGITSATYYGVITDYTDAVLGIVTATTGTSVQFDLKHGQFVKFYNKANVDYDSSSYNLTALPVGTTYVLQEAASTDYTAAWLNAYGDPTTPPTGIVMDNLPFIILILIAIGGFVGYIAVKRKKRY